MTLFIVALIAIAVGICCGAVIVLLIVIQRRRQKVDSMRSTNNLVGLYGTVEVPFDNSLREKLQQLSQEELNEYLLKLSPKQHNTTDLEDRKRTVRAIEIASYKGANIIKPEPSPVKEKIVFGISMERESLRDRIELRLKSRLEKGMLKEVEQLLTKLNAEKLIYYGLEYKFITLYLSLQLTVIRMEIVRETV